VLLRLLYVAIPRLLGRLPDYDPPAVLGERIGALEREAASFAALKSDTFRTMYERALAQPAALSRASAGWPDVQWARTALPPVETDDFDRVLRLLEQRAALRGTLRRRRLYRGLLTACWRVHVALSLLAMAVALLHILDAVLLRHRLN
jgi:hypothetical protein